MVGTIDARSDWENLGSRNSQRQRQAVIAANPELLERDLIKNHSIAVGFIDALRQHGVDADIARLAAQVRIQLFITAYVHWLEAGAKADLTMISESVVSRTSAAIAAILFIWIIHRLRVRQVARAVSVRSDERLAERTRMARELHDTFIQTIQGSKMVVDDALEKPSDLESMHHALSRLAVWLELATRKARAALNSLRESTSERNNLREAFQRIVDGDTIPSLMAACLSVVGDVRKMHPIVRDEVYRIGYEAIQNASQHSRATRLDIELRYGRDLTLRVSDNGVGIDPFVLDKGREGHFGLQGMRERSGRIGGTLTLVSTTTSGTVITLVVPGGLIDRSSRSP